MSRSSRSVWMRRLCLVGLGWCLAGTASAQEERGAWALQFRVTDNFTLGSFNGSILSMKRHFDPHHAIRASLDLGNTHRDSESGPDTLLTRQESSSNSVGLGADYLWYATPQSPISLFLGCGPLFRYQKATSRYVASSGGFETSTTNTSKTWGARAVIGVEWFVTRQIGLHSEYGVQFQRSTYERTSAYSGGPPPPPSSSTIRSLGGQSAFLGASVYF